MTNPSHDPQNEDLDPLLYAALQSRPEHHPARPLAPAALALVHAQHSRADVLHRMRRWQTAGLAVAAIVLIVIMSVSMNWLMSDSTLTASTSTTSTTTYTTSASSLSNDVIVQGVVALSAIIVIGALWKVLESDPTPAL